MRSAAPSPAGRSAALVASLLAATALCVFSQYGFDSHPLGAHGGFWIYQAQTLLHGESPYATSFLRDPPLGPMLLASALALAPTQKAKIWIAEPSPKSAGLNSRL